MRSRPNSSHISRQIHFCLQCKCLPRAGIITGSLLVYCSMRAQLIHCSGDTLPHGSHAPTRCRSPSHTSHHFKSLSPANAFLQVRHLLQPVLSHNPREPRPCRCSVPVSHHGALLRCPLLPPTNFVSPTPCRIPCSSHVLSSPSLPSQPFPTPIPPRSRLRFCSTSFELCRTSYLSCRAAAADQPMPRPYHPGGPRRRNHRSYSRC